MFKTFRKFVKIYKRTILLFNERNLPAHSALQLPNFLCQCVSIESFSLFLALSFIIFQYYNMVSLCSAAWLMVYPQINICLICRLFL